MCLSFCVEHYLSDRQGGPPTRLAAQNGGSERRTCHASINHQLDRVDVRGVVGGKEKHSFGQFFRFAPTAQSNRGGDEVSELSRLLGGIVGAGPTLPDGSLGCSGCDNV